MMKDWTRHEYIHPLSGDVTAIEIVPNEDLWPHRSTEDCNCLPELSTIDAEGTMMLVHNAFDGREFKEGEVGH